MSGAGAAVFGGLKLRANHQDLLCCLAIVDLATGAWHELLCFHKAWKEYSPGAW